MFFYCFCWLVLTTVFPSLVNDGEDGSYLIVFFYVMSSWSRITIVKLTKKEVFMISVWLSLNV